jgi:alpha-beta hydrolase superfamily lysophospholipase
VVTAVVAAGAAAAGGLYALDRVANQVVRPVPRPPAVSVPELGYGHEDVLIPAGDHALRGWLVYPDEPGRRPLVLLVHGWGANYGTLLGMAESLVEAGHAVLLFDVQGHGRNGPAAYVTVRHFRDDVAAAARYAALRFPDRERVLVGHSLGGAAAVLAAEHGAPVDGLVVVAAPADVLEVIASYLRDKGFPGGFMVVALRPFWWVRIGGTFRHLVPERKIGAVRLPVLILQPEHDQRVPREHAVRLARAAGASFHLIAGAGHTDVLDAPETRARVLAFLQEVAQGERS